jgi:1,4-alpha-glucan branching enzyme
VVSLDADGAGFHAQWDAEFVHPVREALITPADEHRSVHALAAAVSHSYGDAFARVIYTESHDEVANGKQRVPSEIDEGDPDGWFAQKRSTAAACFVFTAPGIPMVFQGQEFLEKGWFRDDVPLDWWRNEEFHGLVRLYRDLIRLRRNADGDTAGLRGEGLSVHHVDEDGNLLAYHRWAEGGPGDDVVVIANMSAQERTGVPIGMPAAGGWRLKFNSDATTYSDVFHGFPAQDVEAAPEPLDGKEAHALIDIGPYTVLVYVRA